MGLGAIHPRFSFDHVSLWHVNAAVIARQHGAGLQGGRRLSILGWGVFWLL